MTSHLHGQTSVRPGSVIADVLTLTVTGAPICIQHVPLRAQTSVGPSRVVADVLTLRSVSKISETLIIEIL